MASGQKLLLDQGLSGMPLSYSLTGHVERVTNIESPPSWAHGKENR